MPEAAALKEGVGNAGRDSAPAALRADEKSTQASHHGYARTSRHSRTRMVLTAYGALSPVIGLCCHRRQRNA
jgi:hypothetical protein